MGATCFISVKCYAEKIFLRKINILKKLFKLFEQL